MIRKVARYAALCALLLPAEALAHHPGGTSNAVGAGPINTIPASTLEAGHVGVAFLYEMIQYGGLGDAALIAAAGRHQHAHSIGTIASVALGAAIGITDDFMLSLRLPYVRRTDIREGHHAHGAGGAAINTVDDRGDADGVGDMTVLGQWRFFDATATGAQAAVLFGFKAPTGATGVRDRAGELLETEFQPGSGSLDALLGAAFTQRFGSWSFDANMLGVFAGKGAQETNLGRRVQYNAAVSYRLFGGSSLGAGRRDGPAGRALSHSPEGLHSHNPIQVRDDVRRHVHEPEPPAGMAPMALDLVLELNGEWHDKQTVAGVRDPNSGGNVVYLSPGLRISHGTVSGFASVGLPVINEMNGLQSKASWRIVSGFAAAF
ncbi:MAG: hypothetical protein IRZ09_13075 [Variibacter sp.]|nr:hypothetical protein [Variibacter sp.]